jgi:hypothetical protein
LSWLSNIHSFYFFSSTPEPNTKQSHSVLLLFCNQIKNRVALFYLTNVERSHSITEYGAGSFRSLRFLYQTSPKCCFLIPSTCLGINLEFPFVLEVPNLNFMIIQTFVTERSYLQCCHATMAITNANS